MDYQLFCFPENEPLGRQLLDHPGLQAGEATLRRFPDGESYARLRSDVQGKKVAVLCTLHQPDDKLMLLYFFSRLARQQGAQSVTLIAPYLAYMRQDKAFQPGEAVTSELFAGLLSDWVDALVTVDPHLHRHRSLSEIYHIPTQVVHVEPLIVRYLEKHVSRPVLIGPDEESRQWVAGVAEKAGCPFLVLQKERLGDREVRVAVPEAPKFRQHTPVLVDDIISTGRTMLETARHLQEHGLPPPVCIGVHAVFAGHAWREMQEAGIRQVVTSNTIAHPTNKLDVAGLLIDGLREPP